MVSIYDKALLKRIKGWTERADIHVYTKEEVDSLFSLAADSNGDKPIKLPIIELEREGAYKIQNVNSAPPTRNGYPIMYNELMSMQLNVIPIEINYKINVYTSYFEEADAYIRDLIFNILNHPKDILMIHYNNSLIEHDYNLTLDPSVSDKTGLNDTKFNGTYSKMTIGVSIKDAYLWSVPVHATLRLDEEGIWIQPKGRLQEQEQVKI